MAKVGVHIVTWNGKKYLEHLFGSLKLQTFKDFHVRVFDNGSVDGTDAWIKEHINKYVQSFDAVYGDKNHGFARGHNTLFAFARGHDRKEDEHYVLLMNQDTWIEPEYIGELVRFLDKHVCVASATGMIVRWSPDNVYEIRDRKIDSAGLAVKKTRKVIERLAGYTFDRKQGLLYTRVFGVSATLPIYRWSALDEVVTEGQVFDADFDSYKEDIDLACRLQSRGFDSAVAHSTLGYHDRTMGERTARSDRSLRQRRNSYRNHFLVLIKNEYGGNFVRHAVWIIGYEIGKFFYLLFREPRVLAGLVDVFRLLPKMLKKRKLIKARRKRSAAEIRKWFV